MAGYITCLATRFFLSKNQITSYKEKWHFTKRTNRMFWCLKQSRSGRRSMQDYLHQKSDKSLHRKWLSKRFTEIVIRSLEAINNQGSSILGSWAARSFWCMNQIRGRCLLKVKVLGNSVLESSVNQWDLFTTSGSHLNFCHLKVESSLTRYPPTLCRLFHLALLQVIEFHWSRQECVPTFHLV